MSDKEYIIDILKLEKNQFKYGLFNDDISIRKIKLFICLRVLFLADQLHDFTESRAQIGIDPSLLAKGLSPSVIATIKLTKKREMNQMIFTKLFSESFEDIKNFTNNKIKIPENITKKYKFNNNYDFLKLYEEKTYGNNSIITKIRNFLITLQNYRAIQKKGESRTQLPAYYDIVTQISQALGYEQFKIFDKLTNNGIPYFCSLGYDYLKGAVKIGYLDRYNSIGNIDENVIQIGVDADKSRFAISDIVKVICDFAPIESDYKAQFIKSLSTEYDASGKSGTESMLENIIDSRKGVYRNENVSITEPDNYNDSERYILKIGDIMIMNFILKKNINIQSTILTLYSKFIKDKNDITQNDIKLFPTEYQNFRRNLKNYLVTYTTGFTINNMPNSISDVTKKLNVPNLPATFSKLDDCIKFFTIMESISKKINKSVKEILDSNIITKQQMTINLKIDNFFRDYSNEQLIIDNKNNSVSKIFSSISSDINNKNLSYTFAFKTLGDFSQILSFMTNDSEYIDGVYIPKKINKFFITFDKICSRIAPIFIHGILFEHVSKSVVTTLIPFHNKYGDFSKQFKASAIISNLSNPIKAFIPDGINYESDDPNDKSTINDVNLRILAELSSRVANLDINKPQRNPRITRSITSIN